MIKHKGKLYVLATIVCLLFSVVGCSKENGEIVELNISAAASLKEAMEELKEEYKKENENIDLTINFGASGSLQQQIEQGAPCDVFISAGKKQMDSLESSGILLENTYKNLVKNRLVLIASEDSKINNIDDLSTDKVKYVGVGEPNSVPAGKYADEVLTNLEIKDKIKDKLVFAKDVKEVLAWTKSGNADVGFVYYSDAMNTEGIKIIEEISEDTHSPIIYPVAVMKESKKADEAKKFEEFLLSDKSQQILEKYGYKSTK